MGQKSPDVKLQAQWVVWLRRLVLAGVLGMALITVYVGLSGKFNLFKEKTYPIDWAKIPAGSFLMGSPEDDPSALMDESPQHRVYLSAYKISRYLITNQQYAQCVLAGICEKPSFRIDEPALADYPVVDVTWEQAQTFCNWNGGRLPTEAEWEKAARGGLVGALYPWGDEIDCSYANYGDCVGEASPAGSYPPNPFDLFDMAGNVYEWTADWYSGNYYRNTPKLNPGGPAEGEHRVLRGGCWGEDPSFMRAAFRAFSVPGYPHDFIGFRCAYSAVPWRR